MSSVLIRGDLKIHVTEAKQLSNADKSFLSFKSDISDPFCEILIAGKPILISRTDNNSQEPKWNAKAVVPLCYPEDSLVLKVWDEDYIGNTLLGEATISLQPSGESWEKKDWIKLKGCLGEVYVALSFVPFSPPEDVLKHEPLGVDTLYFGAREGGGLRLYQDAHNEVIEGLESRESRNVFRDMVESFEKARRLIYISGWSVWTQLMLRRDEDKRTIGELLKKKANEGVRVLILIWNERFSAKLCNELFGTHDTMTLKFFANTNVIVVAARRQPDKGSKVMENVIETIYTHHIKTIVVDCPEAGLVAFIGGLDLTDGRWDTPEHYFWKTLNTSHKGDFYNGFVPKLTGQTGPREPWHDVHSRLEGYAAVDILRLFEERWTKQATKYAKNLVPYPEDELIKYIPHNPRKTRKWHMQVLRSADSDSCLFFPRLYGLNSCGNKLKDCSTHHGLISLVRSCKKFIYIESQYFIGSALYWHTLKDTCAFNILPIEICEQISHSIRIGQPIRTYVLVPMCPEGDPSSYIGACYMSEILHWQFLTIQMMYSRIATTLKEIGSKDHPEDFLLFLCLGKKLKKESATQYFPADSKVKKGSEAENWRQKSRFPIYVHSKMVLVDDARIVIGSANLNQRSLDGSRDTEACIAASQVDHEDENSPKLITDGEVSRFRRSLWSEHTGGLSEQFSSLKDPSTKTCISVIKDKALESLNEYISEEVDKDITFRYMKYPLDVDINGRVTEMKNITKIPDFDLPVIGANGFIPANVTT